jgi:hypothetical protein
MSHEVFDTLNLIRDLQAQYAAFRAQQHFVTAHGMGCATTARLEAIAPRTVPLGRCLSPRAWGTVLATVEAIPAMRRDGRSSPGRPCPGDPSP